MGCNFSVYFFVKQVLKNSENKMKRECQDIRIQLGTTEVSLFRISDNLSIPLVALYDIHD